MKVSPDGLNRIVAREGERLTAYRDTVGVLTIGVGHTAACGPPIPVPGLKITREESRAALARDLGRFEDAIARAVKVRLEPHEFDALVSIAFNVGPKFATSTCVRRLNAGDRIGAAHAIMMWDKPPEIIGRRTGEMRQFSEAAARPDVLREAAAKQRQASRSPATAGGAAVAAMAASVPAGFAANKGTPMWGVALAGILAAAIVIGLAVKAWRHAKLARAIDAAAKEG